MYKNVAGLQMLKLCKYGREKRCILTITCNLWELQELLVCSVDLQLSKARIVSFIITDRVFTNGIK